MSNRKRTNGLYIMLTDEEYELFKEKMKMAKNQVKERQLAKRRKQEENLLKKEKELKKESRKAEMEKITNRNS